MARRVPGGVCVVMPNQLGLDTLDLDDALGEQKEFMCSADLRAFIDKYHLDCPGRCMNPRDAFGSPTMPIMSTARPPGWYMLRYFQPQYVRLDGPDADFTAALRATAPQLHGAGKIHARGRKVRAVEPLSRDAV